MLSCCRGSAVVALSLCAFLAHAGPAQLKMVPDHFLLEADEGDEVTQNLTLINGNPVAVAVRVRAVNWGLDADGRRIYEIDQTEGQDCRGWWLAGGADLQLPPGASVSHALQIQVPEEMEDEFECRFALSVQQVYGEIASPPTYVPVIVRVDDPEPEITFERFVLAMDDAGKKPMVMIRNEGTAMARVYGMLQGEDRQGHKLDVIVRPTEILPGERRGAPLLIGKRGGGEVWWTKPVSVEGKLIWGDEDISVSGKLR